MKKVKKNEDLIMKRLAIVIVILVGFTTLINILSDRQKDNPEQNSKLNISNSNITKEETTARKINVDRLQNMGERDRMEYYFSYWLQLVEEEEYETAYNMLYQEFRENYFNTLSEFIQYAQNTFPKMANINHTNIERNGDLYVLWIEISDAINGTKDDVKEMNVVIRENDFANIEMSFSVI